MFPPDRVVAGDAEPLPTTYCCRGLRPFQSTRAQVTSAYNYTHLHTYIVFVDVSLRVQGTRKQKTTPHWFFSPRQRGRGGRGGVLIIMHGRGRMMTIDPRTPTMPGRGTSGFYRPGRHCLHQARGGGH